MKILYITDTGSIIGGGEVSLLILLQNLPRERIVASLIAPQEGDLTEAVRKLGIPVTILPFKKVANSLNIFSTYQTMQRLVEIIRRDAIELIHANATGGLVFLAGLAARRAHIPFISHIRIMNSGLLSLLWQSILAQRIIAVSVAVKRQFNGIPFSRGKVAVVPNAVDEKPFLNTPDRAAFRKEIAVACDAPLIGTAVGYSFGKGLDYFIMAAAEIVRQVPDARFVIVGLDAIREASAVNTLKQMASDRKIAEKIIFLGHRDDLPAVLFSFDVFMFTTLRESFGRVAVEAMCAQKPVIAFKVGGVEEVVVDQQTGFLVECPDFRAMARKAVMLLNDKNLSSHMGKKGCARAQELFGIDTHIDHMVKVYEEVSRQWNYE